MSEDTTFTIEKLSKLQFSTYFHVAAIALFVYEYFLTLHDEVSLVWKKRMRPGGILFLLNRYPTFASLPFSLYIRLADNLPKKRCKFFVDITTGMFYFGFVVAELLMLLRVWALWGRTRSITIFLCILSIIGLVASAVVFAVVRDPKSAQPMDDRASLIPGCTLVSGVKMTLLQYAMLMAFQTLILFMTLIRCVQQSRRDPSSLFASFMRNGVSYFICVLIVSIINVIIILIKFDDTMNIVTSLQRGIHSILVARIFIQLRKGSNRDPGNPATLLVDGTIRTIAFAHTTQSTLHNVVPPGESALGEGVDDVPTEISTEPR